MPLFGKRGAQPTAKCRWCGKVNQVNDVNSDLMICLGTTQRACGRLIPTGREKIIRKTQEAWCGGPRSLYPNAAVARAIGFAAGIYKLATHGRAIRYGAIDKQVANRFGNAPAAVSQQVGGGINRKLSVQVNNQEQVVTDRGVGIVIVKVEGDLNNKKWSQIYVVFRGSRGEGAATNPNQAGWADFGNGANQADVHCIDWLTNFKNKLQVQPQWCAAVKVHQGFYDLYSGCRKEIKHQVIRLYQQLSAAKGSAPQVIVTGHSLGAALATLCAHDLDAVTSVEPFCFTFNSPRVGDLKFVRDFNRNLADQKAVLNSEPGGDFYRGYTFQRENDPVSSATEHGVERDVDTSAADAQQDRGRTSLTTGATLGLVTQKRAIDAAGVSATAIYYHIQNRFKISRWDITMKGAHQFNLMEEQLMGMSVSDRQ